MKISGCFLNFTATIFLCLSLFAAKSLQAQEASKESSSASGPKIFGEFTFTTNYMEQAISNSNNSYAVQPALGYQWPTAQIGIRSSNVQFPDNGESLNLRPYAWYQFIFAASVDLKVRYDLNMYFASNSRNGDIFRADLNLFTHHLIVENNSNWYGTGTAAYWLAYGHSWPTPWGIEYKLEAGYLMGNATNYSSYFGIQNGFGYKYGDFYYELLGSFNSNADQFSHMADPAIWLEISTKF